LVHAGLLDPRPGDGTYVRADTGLDAALERAARRWGALDALEVRNMLERDAARLARRPPPAPPRGAAAPATWRRSRRRCGTGRTRSPRPATTPARSWTPTPRSTRRWW